MNILQLNYFISVAESGSFTKAAALNYTSQPTISRQIHMLEEELGYSLFKRNSNPLTLTHSGRILYNGVVDAKSKLTLAINLANMSCDGESGTLSISFQAGYYSEYMFLPFVEKFRKRYPGIQLQLSKLYSWEQNVGIMNGSIDIAIGLDFPHWKQIGLNVENLTKVEKLVVMSKDHRLVGKKKLHFDDIKGETFFLTAPNGYEVEKVFNEKLDFSGIKQIKVCNSESAYFKVLAENGLTISNPDDPYLINNPLYYSIKFDEKYSDSYVLVTNKANKNNILKLFLEEFSNS